MEAFKTLFIPIFAMNPNIFFGLPGTLRTSEGIAAEIEWIRYLAEKGVSVSAPVSSVNGRDVERIHGHPMDFYAASFNYAPGTKVGYPECLRNPMLYEQCGRITGRLHELAKRYKPVFRRHTWETNEYLVRAKDYLPAELRPILHALDEIKAELASLPVTSDNFGLIHGDINVGNFMVDESGKITLLTSMSASTAGMLRILLSSSIIYYMYLEKIRGLNVRSNTSFYPAFRARLHGGWQAAPRWLEESAGVVS